MPHAQSLNDHVPEIVGLFGNRLMVRQPREFLAKNFEHEPNSSKREAFDNWNNSPEPNAVIVAHSFHISLSDHLISRVTMSGFTGARKTHQMLVDGGTAPLPFRKSIKICDSVSV